MSRRNRSRVVYAFSIKFSRSSFNRHWNYSQILNLCSIDWKTISVSEIFYFYYLYLNFKSLTDRCQTLNNNFQFSMFCFRFSIFDCWMIVDVVFENFFDDKNLSKSNRFSLSVLIRILNFKFNHFNKRLSSETRFNVIFNQKVLICFVFNFNVSE